MKNIEKKYIYIGVGIAIFIIILSICLFFIFKNKHIKYNTLTSSDGSFQISFPNNINYQVNDKENNEFVIDLFSKKDEMFFYVSRIEKSRMIDLFTVANDDKENYLKDKENIYNDSGLVSFDVHNYKGYEYSFIYTDNSYGKDFYCNIMWIETDKNLYVLNFEVIKDRMEYFKDIFINIRNSFVEL